MWEIVGAAQRNLPIIKESETNYGRFSLRQLNVYAVNNFCLFYLVV